MSVLWQGAKSKNFKRFEKLCCDLFNVIRKNANLFINMMSLVSTQHNKHNNKPTASATQQPQATAASNSRNSTQCDIPRHDKRHTTPYDSTPYDRATQHVPFQLQHCCAVPFVIIPLRGCPLTSPRCRLLLCLACCLPACVRQWPPLLIAHHRRCSRCSWRSLNRRLTWAIWKGYLYSTRQTRRRQRYDTHTHPHTHTPCTALRPATLSTLRQLQMGVPALESLTRCGRLSLCLSVCTDVQEVDQAVAGHIDDQDQLDSTHHRALLASLRYIHVNVASKPPAGRHSVSRRVR